MEAFNEAVLRIVKGYHSQITSQVTMGIVKEITGSTCMVERENLPPLQDVRLNAIEGDFDNHILIIPKIGSKVLCLVIGDQNEETAIIKYTEIEKVIIQIEGAKFEMSGGKFQFKNNRADLKEIHNELLETLNNAIILTPNGAGRFAPTTKQKLNQIKTKNNELFE